MTAPRLGAFRAVLVLAAAMVAAGCNPFASDRQAIPTIPPLDRSRSPAPAPDAVLAPEANATTTVTPGPAPPAGPGLPTDRGPARPRLSGAPAAVAFDSMQLPQFIDGMLGQTLGLSVSMDPDIAKRNDLVTLRTGPRDPNQLFAAAEEVLRNYGVYLRVEGNVVRATGDAVLAASAPRLVRGRTTPEIPGDLRPVFQIVDVEQVSAADMAEWLSNAFAGKLKFTPAGGSNALLIYGAPGDVRAAVGAARALDQARLAGRGSLRIEPVFWGADELAAKLQEILGAEGYDVAIGMERAAALGLVVVTPTNAIIAFGSDRKVLDHVAQWVRDLDRPARADPKRGIFVYLVKNTTADSLGEVVRGVLEGKSGRDQEGSRSTEALDTGVQTEGSRLGGTAQGTGAAPGLGQTAGLGTTMGQAGAAGLGQTGQATGTTAAGTGRAGGTNVGATGTVGAASGPNAKPTVVNPTSPQEPRLVVDPARNALIFIGTAEGYARVRPLLEALDRAPREALIEVTVAEVQLDNETQFGVEFALRAGSIAGNVGNISTIGGLAIGTAGLRYTVLNSAGDTRAILNAFARDQRVSVLSTPRLLARSGGRARIQVGTEVPIITTQSTQTGVQVQGNTSLLQQIQYRNTGVILNVRPIVHSVDRIDLEISQEVSEAQTNAVSNISSPQIFSRTVSTQLTLRDGATVLLGGLISDSRANTQNGIPGVQNIPLLGWLFKTEDRHDHKTELLVFITPYVLNSDSDSEAITEQFRQRLNAWPDVHDRPRP